MKFSAIQEKERELHFIKALNAQLKALLNDLAEIVSVQPSSGKK